MSRILVLQDKDNARTRIFHSYLFALFHIMIKQSQNSTVVRLMKSLFVCAFPIFPHFRYSCICINRLYNCYVLSTLCFNILI